jgi:hypothetical protein
MLQEFKVIVQSCAMPAVPWGCQWFGIHTFWVGELEVGDDRPDV